jgi:hypothetical protein
LHPRREIGEDTLGRRGAYVRADKMGLDLFQDVVVDDLFPNTRCAKPSVRLVRVRVKPCFKR